jgi:hypothetical protein
METFKMLKVALGKQALWRTQVSEWIFIARDVNCAEKCWKLGMSSDSKTD